MVVPVMAGPVDDEGPAGQLDADGEEEKYLPTLTHLEENNSNSSNILSIIANFLQKWFYNFKRKKKKICLVYDWTKRITKL